MGIFMLGIRALQYWTIVCPNEAFMGH